MSKGGTVAPRRARALHTISCDLSATVSQVLLNPPQMKLNTERRIRWDGPIEGGAGKTPRI
ncbi:hypothetical protein CROQUDRAFT_94075 [Cronartium quercuum f. sp. fusiforme G11]|uniref:Uncharacterized protein n=1 Tax=Cronartium quercuum f. sp. fusiforme G11 TaxID=708437 RepID=A0A9P6NGL7_9BASI|nr:hypothetical protein CROQUDRAFT_94075 [Cronartium quercuum f. sp. fusiforme G11]